MRKVSFSNIISRCMNVKLSLPFFIFVLSIIFLNTYLIINIYEQKSITNELLRLHVVSNSNNTDDLVEKLKISNEVTTYISNLDLGNTKQTAVEAIKSNIDEIIDIANNCLKEDNIDYTAYAKLGNIHYSKKENANVTMPEGNYDSLQVVLGEGNGTNFWSLIFPSKENISNLEGLETIIPGIAKIYGDNTSNENLKIDENYDNSDIDDNNEEKVTYSFKILEIIDSIKNKLRN